ncbi:MAG TPA: hypothetical protein VG675_14580 [Bryobacteraceae bacterium]|nr:hypothetical protein [Bryobacteraceae bacterium]
MFRDLGRVNADAEQFNAMLAAEIIKLLDREHLTVRAAHGRAGIAPSASCASGMWIWDGSRLIA